MPPDDLDALAGELALGLLEGDERASALRLMLSDPGFAGMVDQWRVRTAGLFDAIEPVDPPAGAWAAIAARIGPDTSGAAHPAPVALLPEPASLRWWRRGAVSSAAIAACLALLLVARPAPSPAPQSPAGPVAVAQLTGPIAGLRIATRYDLATGTLRVRASGMPDTPTEPELWIVSATGMTVSLGQIDRDGETVIAVPRGHRGLITPQAHFSLSMEPRSAAPSAAPTADFVAQGPIDLV